MSIRGRFRKPSGNDEAAQAALARAVQHAAQQHTAEESASQVASQVPKEEHTTDVVAPLLRADQGQNAATEGKEAGKKDKHRKVLPILVGATAAMVIAAGILLGVSGTGSKPGEQAAKQHAAIHKTVPRQGSVPTLPTKGKVQGLVNIPQKKSPTAPAETKVPAANNTRTTATAASTATNPPKITSTTLPTSTTVTIQPPTTTTTQPNPTPNPTPNCSNDTAFPTSQFTLDSSITVGANRSSSSPTGYIAVADGLEPGDNVTFVLLYSQGGKVAACSAQADPNGNAYSNIPKPNGKFTLYAYDTTKGTYNEAANLYF